MYKNKRQQEIAAYVFEHTEATVNELSQLFSVSQVTIRKDLVELAEKGVIFKTHGGATQTEHLMVNEIPYYKKYTSSIAEKKKIGKLAASLINENDIVIIDNGSTTNEIVSYMEDQEIVVITNDVRIGYRLALFSKMDIVISGGYLKKGGFSMFGSSTEQMFNQTLADICFLSVDSLDVDNGISYNYLDSVSVKKNILKNSKKIIAVCDSSKIGKRSFAKLCDVSEIDILITDFIDKETKEKIEQLGVKVMIA